MEAAFFDLDKTIIARPSLAAYGPVLRKAGYLSATTTLRAFGGSCCFVFLVPANHQWREFVKQR